MLSPDRRRPLRHHAVRQRAADLLAVLDVEPPLDVRVLCRRMEETRHRPLQVIPHSFPRPDVFGFWLATGDSDLIFYEEGTTPAHQQHIVLHEIGHIALEHGMHRGENGPPEDNELAWRALLPSLPAGLLRIALSRSAYDTVAEQEAETFASIVREWFNAAQGRDRPRPTALEQVLDQPRGWT